VFGFPFALQPQTTIDARGRVLYRRLTEDDAWVVPYMPSLTQFMQCHINVDICFTVNVFMYLFKYLFKGPDRARFAFTVDTDTTPLPSGPSASSPREDRAGAPAPTPGPTNDSGDVRKKRNELKDFVEGRYLSASEAIWRIFGFDITRKTPGVVSIPIHLPDDSTGMFSGGLRQDNRSASKLIRYFQRPQDECFRALTIQQYYSRY